MAVAATGLDSRPPVSTVLRVGTVNVDGGVRYSADMPFGGYEQSSPGPEMGPAGFEEYLETKAIASFWDNRWW